MRYSRYSRWGTIGHYLVCWFDNGDLWSSVHNVISFLQSILAATRMHMVPRIVASQPMGYPFSCATVDGTWDDSSMCVGFGPGDLHQGLHGLAEVAENKSKRHNMGRCPSANGCKLLSVVLFLSVVATGAHRTMMIGVAVQSVGNFPNFSGADPTVQKVSNRHSCDWNCVHKAVLDYIVVHCQMTFRTLRMDAPMTNWWIIHWISSSSSFN